MAAGTLWWPTAANSLFVTSLLLIEKYIDLIYCSKYSICLVLGYLSSWRWSNNSILKITEMICLYLSSQLWSALNCCCCFCCCCCCCSSSSSFPPPTLAAATGGGGTTIATQITQLLIEKKLYSQSKRVCCGQNSKHSWSQKGYLQLDFKELAALTINNRNGQIWSLKPNFISQT